MLILLSAIGILCSILGFECRSDVYTCCGTMFIGALMVYSMCMLSIEDTVFTIGNFLFLVFIYPLMSYLFEGRVHDYVVYNNR